MVNVFCKIYWVFTDFLKSIRNEEEIIEINNGSDLKVYRRRAGFL